MLRKIRYRLAAILLAFCLTLTLMPVTVFAIDNEETATDGDTDPSTSGNLTAHGDIDPGEEPAATSGIAPLEASLDGMEVTVTDLVPGNPQAEIMANETPQSVTLDLTGYGTFEAAVAAAGITQPGNVTSITITGKTSGGTWLLADGKYLLDNFTAAAALDLSGYTGKFAAGAFVNNHGVTTVRLPQGAAISMNMFTGCTSLATLICGDGPFEPGVVDLTGAVSLESQSFASSGITAARLPSSLGIPDNMFNRCVSLGTLYFVGGNAPAVGFAAFDGVPATGNLHYPAGASGYEPGEAFSDTPVDSWTRHTGASRDDAIIDLEETYLTGAVTRGVGWTYNHAAKTYTVTGNVTITGTVTNATVGFAASRLRGKPRSPEAPGAATGL